MDISSNYQSWGRIPRSHPADITIVSDSHSPLPIQAASLSYIPFGCGSSYGDVCLNSGQGLIGTRRLSCLLGFDRENGILRAEAGATIAEILEVCVPQGWFLPVVPGTQFVTLGGAVANDIHGKNHHIHGTLGNHVRALELLRSDGSRLICSANENQELFNVTVAGLGLTGLISWVELQLLKIPSAYLLVTQQKFSSIEDWFDTSREFEPRFSYTVAWIDCASSGKSFGRGILMGADFAEDNEFSCRERSIEFSIPEIFPAWALSATSARIFNHLYFHRPGITKPETRVHFRPFFFPLDTIRNWNRLYGREGFFQYQFVLPQGSSKSSLVKILNTVKTSGLASYLGVLKRFGSLRSPGRLSFPTEGITLALDFPNRGLKTLELFERLDREVLEANGRIYPAKDARMGGSSFRKMYPDYLQLEKLRDPKFSSQFWRRVTGYL